MSHNAGALRRAPPRAYVHREKSGGKSQCGYARRQGLDIERPHAWRLVAESRPEGLRAFPKANVANVTSGGTSERIFSVRELLG